MGESERRGEGGKRKNAVRRQGAFLLLLTKVYVYGRKHEPQPIGN